MIEIPEGTRVYLKGKYLCTTLVGINNNYFPCSIDFEPELKASIRNKELEWFFRGKLIFSSLNFNKN